MRLIFAAFAALLALATPALAGNLDSSIRESTCFIDGSEWLYSTEGHQGKVTFGADYPVNPELPRGERVFPFALSGMWTSTLLKVFAEDLLKLHGLVMGPGEAEDRGLTSDC